MGRTIAIGDIHGCRKALAKLLETLRLERDDTLVTLGDYVDRGPDSRGVIEELLEVRKSCQLVALSGNHEWMMLGSRTIGTPTLHWLKAGGLATLESYGGTLAKVPDDHFAFLCSLRSHHETDAAILVHAGYLPDREMHEQTNETLYWDHIRSSNPPPPHQSGKTAIVGHSPQRNGVPLDLGHLLCIDTYCCGGQWLTAVDLESREIWQTNLNGGLRRDPLRALRNGYRHCFGSSRK
ncbi:metallophosphoesterase family protein [Candidatus Laterigemmans baculatus]|uniref:metallophosphoesterase family protein n=1 Tax=Candidatus Laterigemmans baculatus TaxID=2770505 RepID=UPI0013DD4FB9|nr:metallophosphoesterase family protein [Candidatus Laterigemmans baculatus]